MSDGSILWFEECRRERSPQVGGKCAGLGELISAGVRVPPGFAVTTEAYYRFLVEAGIRDPICRLLGQTCKGAPVAHVGREVRDRILAAPLPPDVERAIRAAYRSLAERCGVADLPVAVRSSATFEDLADASFAGQQDTYLWVRGEGPVVRGVLACWSSLFTDRVIAYREERGFSHENVRISVGVQKMVRARTSGVLFTLNPVNGDRSKVAINSAWGFGEGIVSGEITPDDFLVDKVTFDILRRDVVAKPLAYLLRPEEDRVGVTEVPEADRMRASLSDEEIAELTRLARQIERHQGGPVDVEWAVDADLPFPENILILQSRPETVWSLRVAKPINEGGKSALEAIVGGLVKGVPVKLRDKRAGATCTGATRPK